MINFLKNLFKKRYTTNYSEYTAREKKKIIDQAAALACEDQLLLVKKYEKEFNHLRQ